MGLPTGVGQSGLPGRNVGEPPSFAGNNSSTGIEVGGGRSRMDSLKRLREAASHVDRARWFDGVIFFLAVVLGVWIGFSLIQFSMPNLLSGDKATVKDQRSALKVVQHYLDSGDLYM